METPLVKIQYTLNGTTYVRDFKVTDDAIKQLQQATQDATTELKGIIELATNEETNTGTDSTRAVTPAGLKFVLDPINKKIEDVASGTGNLAYKDYTQPDNQSEMVVGVIYLVPFNKSDEFIPFDKETGKPSAEGAPTDTTVSYFKRMYKPKSGSIQELGKQYTQGHLENVAYTNVANTFTELNTFNSGAAFTNGITSDTLTLSSSGTVSGNFNVSGDLVATKGIDIASGSGSTVVPNAGQIKTYVDSFKPEVKPSSESGAGTEGVIYFFYDE